MCKQTHLPLNITFCIFSGIPANEKIIYCKCECPKFNTNNWIIALRTVCDPVSTIPTQINNLLTQFFMRNSMYAILYKDIRFVREKFSFVCVFLNWVLPKGLLAITRHRVTTKRRTPRRNVLRKYC